MIAQAANQIDVYLEIGKARTFAIAPGWPGWCRSGPDDASALQALFDYGPRYARVLQAAQVPFQPPSQRSTLVVVERLAGNATTDFGAPALALPRDTQPIERDELQRFQAVLQACWETLDATVEAAAGRALRKGPRGGGRDLAKIVEHIYGVDVAYLRSLGGKPQPGGEGDLSQALAQVRRDIHGALVAATRGELPALGPRGGARWTPRYFVRRLAWHELDHVWEIENRFE